MKKHIILLPILIICAGVLFQGCQKEESDGQVTLKAVLSDNYSQQNNSKTHVIDKRVYWDNGDSVNINGTPFEIKVTTTASATTATIEKVPYSDNGYVAIYPAGFVTTPGSVTASSESVSITIPSILYMKPGKTENVRGLMVATMERSGTSLPFHNAGSVLALDVTNGFTNEADLKLYRIKVASSTSGLSGSGTLSIDGSVPSYSISSSGTTLTLDMENDTITYNETKTYYIPIPPQTQDGGTQFTVTIYATNGDNHYVFTRNSNSGLTVYRNQQVSVPVEMNATSGYIETTTGGNGLMGSGTAADPYVIATLTDLKYFRSQVASGISYYGEFFRQTADINTGEEVWSGPGTMNGSNYANYFSGIYDGGNHSITLNLKAENYNGLFKYMYKGTIKNLKLYGNAYSTDKSDFGAFCGITIDQTSTDGGSVVTDAKSTFYNCENHINLSGTSNIGGIVGHAKGPIEIEKCKNYGTITASSSSNATLGAGGIIGKAEYSVVADKTTSTSILTVKGCENHATVTATTSNSTKGISAGGCIGLMTCIGSITDCINDASISGDCNVGGIIGKSGTSLNYEITIIGCKNIGNGEKKIEASVAGTNNSGLGGIIGYSNKAITMKKCLNTMVIENTGSGIGLYVGGLIGLIPADIKEMSDCGNRGYINSKKSFAVAGLANGKGAMTVVNSYNTGDVNFQVSGGSRKAGFVTFNNTTDAKITLTNCYFSGNLTGQTTSYDCDMISENKKNLSSKTTNCYSKTKTNANTSYCISANYVIYSNTNNEYYTTISSVDYYLKNILNTNRSTYSEWITVATGANQYKEYPHLKWED